MSVKLRDKVAGWLEENLKIILFLYILFEPYWRNCTNLNLEKNAL